MAIPQESVSMALFCDFENVALGVRDANYDKFDIKRVLERLLLKGSIVVKKAYCDWGRYKDYKATMHEASFELIDIPHVRQSGKNSADIRLVVDALDLCYTKSHVDTFVIISGDSDFSPLVSKLRENNKQVIGVGVKQSTSDLLITNCDEFIFYDDLVRESQRVAARREQRAPQSAPAQGQQPRRSEGDKPRKDDVEARRSKAIDLAVETFDALSAERGDGGKIWASMLKEAIKRRRPDFNESYFGFRAFGNLLEAAQERGLLAFDRDEKSGTYVYRPTGVIEVLEDADAPVESPLNRLVEDAVVDAAPVEEGGRRGRGRQRGRGAREDRVRTQGREDRDEEQDEPVAEREFDADVHEDHDVQSRDEREDAHVEARPDRREARQGGRRQDRETRAAAPAAEPTADAAPINAAPVDAAPVEAAPAHPGTAYREPGARDADDSHLGSVPMPTSRGDMQLTEAPAKRARKQPARIAKAAAKAEAAKAAQSPVVAQAPAAEAAPAAVEPAPAAASADSTGEASARSSRRSRGRAAKAASAGVEPAAAAPADVPAQAVAPAPADAAEISEPAGRSRRGRSGRGAARAGDAPPAAQPAAPAAAQPARQPQPAAAPADAARPGPDGDTAAPAKAARKAAPRRARKSAAKTSDAT